MIAVHPDLLETAPDVVEMLRTWGFRLSIYREVAAWQNENNNAGANDAALWWLNGNADIWRDWVRNEAAAAIEAALAANEIPDGWPDE